MVTPTQSPTTNQRERKSVCERERERVCVFEQEGEWGETWACSRPFSPSHTRINSLVSTTLSLNRTFTHTFNNSHTTSLLRAIPYTHTHTYTFKHSHLPLLPSDGTSTLTQLNSYSLSLFLFTSLPLPISLPLSRQAQLSQKANKRRLRVERPMRRNEQNVSFLNISRVIFLCLNEL